MMQYKPGERSPEFLSWTCSAEVAASWFCRILFVYCETNSTILYCLVTASVKQFTTQQLVCGILFLFAVLVVLLVSLVLRLR